MLVDHISNSKNITLTTLTEADSQYYFEQILGDERRYLQILVNFLSNALKFSPKGSKIVVGLKVNEFVVAKQEQKIN